MDLQPRLGYQSYRVKSDPSGFCVIARILEINPDYEITYVSGGVEGQRREDIMVARIPVKIEKLENE